MLRTWVCVISASIILASPAVFAAQDKDEMKAELRQLREKKAQMRDDYDKASHQISVESDEKMAKIKADYRKAHNECIDDRNLRQDKLRRDFETNLKPVLKDEDRKSVV